MHEVPTSTETPAPVPPDVHAGVGGYTLEDGSVVVDAAADSESPITLFVEVVPYTRDPPDRLSVTEPEMQSVTVATRQPPVTGTNRVHDWQPVVAGSEHPVVHTLFAHIVSHGRKRWSMTLINHPDDTTEPHSTGCAPVGTVAVESNARPTVRFAASETEPLNTTRSKNCVLPVGIVRSHVVVPPSILMASSTPACTVVAATSKVRSP